jgi:hypothetical protein
MYTLTRNRDRFRAGITWLIQGPSYRVVKLSLSQFHRGGQSVIPSR